MVIRIVRELDWEQVASLVGADFAGASSGVFVDPDVLQMRNGWSTVRCRLAGASYAASVVQGGTYALADRLVEASWVAAVAHEAAEA